MKAKRIFLMLILVISGCSYNIIKHQEIIDEKLNYSIAVFSGKDHLTEINLATFDTSEYNLADPNLLGGFSNPVYSKNEYTKSELRNVLNGNVYSVKSKFTEKYIIIGLGRYLEPYSKNKILKLENDNWKLIDLAAGTDEIYSCYNGNNFYWNLENSQKIQEIHDHFESKYLVTELKSLNGKWFVALLVVHHKPTNIVVLVNSENNKRYTIIEAEAGGIHGLDVTLNE